jgi:hypothetical protein
MRTWHLVLAVLAFLIAPCLAPSVAKASTAPTTPTFVLKWGVPGGGPGQFSGPWGMTTDALGNVYVVDSANNRIQKFDRLGNFITQWGSEGWGNGEFANPTYAAVAPSGDVYVTDFYNARIQRFTSAGAYVGQWGTYGTGNGQFNVPLGITVDRKLNVYVVDSGNNRVQKFSESGRTAQWGNPRRRQWTVQHSRGIGLSPAGDVYVTDYSNNRVQKFSSTGAYLTQWGTSGSGNGQFSGPSGVGVDAAGNVYVADGNNRVQKFKADGTYLTQWGSAGVGDGQFNNVTDLAVDAAGNVYVVDYNNSRIQKFSGAGAALSEPPAKFLLTWGSLGSGNGQFLNVNDVATDAAGNVYVTDANLHRVEKFSATGAFLTQWGSQGSGNGSSRLPPECHRRSRQRLRRRHAQQPNPEVHPPAAFTSRSGRVRERNGQLVQPVEIATDVNGNVYVADAGNNRIQKFTSTGVYLTQWSHQSIRGRDRAPPATSTPRISTIAASRSSPPTRVPRSGGFEAWNGEFGVSPVSPPTPPGTCTSWTFRTIESRVHLHRRLPHAVGIDGKREWAALPTLGVGNRRRRQRLRRGYQQLPHPEVREPPAIAFVTDVGNDQGEVQLRVLRGSADSPGTGVTITGYEVYRRNDPLPRGRSSPRSRWRRSLSAGRTSLRSRPTGESNTTWWSRRSPTRKRRASTTRR